MRFHSKQDTISRGLHPGPDPACNRDPALSVQITLTPGLYPGSGIYAGPDFYPKVYGICVHSRCIERPINPAMQLDNDIDTVLLANHYWLRPD